MVALRHEEILRATSVSLETFGVPTKVRFSMDRLSRLPSMIVVAVGVAIRSWEAEPTPRITIAEARLRKSLETGVKIAYFPFGTIRVPPPCVARAFNALCRAGPSFVTLSPTA